MRVSLQLALANLTIQSQRVIEVFFFFFSISSVHKTAYKRPGAPFSKDPVTYQARNQILISKSQEK